MSPEQSPKFVRRYADIYQAQVEAVERWVSDVRRREFPSAKETYRA